MLLRIWRAIIDAVGRLARIEDKVTHLQQSADEERAFRLLALKLLGTLQASLDHIIDLLEPGPAVKILFIADLEGQITYGVEEMDLRDDQKVGLTIQPVDKKGNPALLDGVPEWSVSNSELIGIEVAADGLSAVVTAVGPIGAAVVSVKGDADLGEGVTPISGALEVNVTSGAAVKFEIKAGTPEDQ